MKYENEQRDKTHHACLTKTCLLGLMVLLFVGCAGIEDANNVELEKGYQGLTEQNTEWMNMVNQESSLSEFYHSSAGLLFGSEWYLTEGEIERQLHNLDIKRRVVLSVHEHDQTKIFEVGEYILADGAVLTYLTGYDNQDGMWLHRIDVLYEKAENAPGLDVVDEMVFGRDEKWQELISMKDADRLVGELFWKDARYFNLDSGHHTNTYDELVEEYRWIELPDIRFLVSALDYQIVSDDVIYIIGQYQARNEGLYILVITKDEDDIWKNILDANF